MKKIVTLLLLAFFIWGNFSFAKTQAECAAELQAEAAACAPTPPEQCETYIYLKNQCDEEVYATADCATKLQMEAAACAPTPPEQCESYVYLKNQCDDEAYATADCATKLQMEAAACAPTPPEQCETYMYLKDECVDIQDCSQACTDGQQCNCTPTGCTCATPTAWWLADDTTVMGMTIGQKCLLNGQCKFNIYDALGIRKSVRATWDPTSVGIFVQDIVLSATMFIGTIVTIAIIVSGLMRIFAGASGKDPTKAKSWLINAIIGLLIVVSSYLIIRLVQYIAKWF